MSDHETTTAMHAAAEEGRDDEVRYPEWQERDPVTGDVPDVVDAEPTLTASGRAKVLAAGGDPDGAVTLEPDPKYLLEPRYFNGDLLAVVVEHFPGNLDEPPDDVEFLVIGDHDDVRGRRSIQLDGDLAVRLLLALLRSEALARWTPFDGDGDAFGRGLNRGWRDATLSHLRSASTWLSVDLGREADAAADAEDDPPDPF